VEKSNSNAQAVMTPPLAPMATSSSTGSALFVINLCASIAPVRLDGNNIPGLENYRLYQVARNEDGRTRHRLRLGFFTSESHAESVLTVVRQQYPTAFTTCLCEEDRRFTRGFLPDAAPAAPAPRSVAAVAKPAPSTLVAQPKAAAASAATAAKQATPAAAPAKQTPAAAKTLTPAQPEIIELSWEPETPKTEAKTAKPASPTDGLDDFTWEPPSLTPAADAAIAKTVATGIVKAKVEPEKNTSDTAKHPALKLAPKAAPPSKAPVAAKPEPPKPAAAVAKPAAPPAHKPAAAIAASKPDPASSMRVRALDLTFSDPPPAPVDTRRAASTGAFHVGKGVEIKDVGIRLESEPVKTAAPAQTTAAQAKPAAPGRPVTTKPVVTPAPKVPEKSAKPAQTPVVAAAKPATPKPAAAPALPTIRMPTASNVPPPELDSTQTIRALTSAEMEDAAQEKWFAVQLAVSDQPVNLDAMPRLDIFEAYRLYSVATAGSGKIVHSLRLGFFKEAVSAEAVMGYLNTFFGSPSVMRVSVAEHARFKDAPSTKKPAAPAQEAKVVELNNARSARPVVPTVTMEVEPGVDPAATGSFRPLDTGSFKKSASGKHKALRSAAKSAGSTRTARVRTGNTGKHKTLPSLEKKSLAEQLLDEAREVQLSESGIRKLPKNDSLLSRMLGKLTK
jgi:hypothetical protein